MDESIKIYNIVGLDFMQNVQDFFAETMDISIQSFAEGKPLINPSNLPDFCEKYTQSTLIGNQRCKNCLKKWLNHSEKENEYFIASCHAGLMNFGIPIKLEGKCLATVFGGKILTTPPDEKHFRQLAKDLNVDENEYLSAIKKVRVTSAEEFETLAKSLSLIVNSVASIAYAKYILSKKGMDYKIPRNIAIEEWLFLNLENERRSITTRELEVLKLLVLGKTNTEIAKELFISVHTAKAHVSSILEKFTVEDRVQVAVKAVKKGLV